nr:NAD(P)H-binding protein [Arenimonas sp.]
MTSPRCILLAGASGLVGGRVLARLLADPRGPRVLAPVRRPLQAGTARLSALVANLADASMDRELLEKISASGSPPEAFVCCLGTTLRKAGSHEAFLAVDRDLVLRLSDIAHQAGARHAILVSSVGASAQSGNFYLRVKGETERGLSDMGYS